MSKEFGMSKRELQRAQARKHRKEIAELQRTLAEHTPDTPDPNRPAFTGVEADKNYLKMQMSLASGQKSSIPKIEDLTVFPEFNDLASDCLIFKLFGQDPSISCFDDLKLRLQFYVLNTMYTIKKDKIALQDRETWESMLQSEQELKLSLSSKNVLRMIADLTDLFVNDRPDYQKIKDIIIPFTRKEQQLYFPLKGVEKTKAALKGELDPYVVYMNKTLMNAVSLTIWPLIYDELCAAARCEDRKKSLFSFDVNVLVTKDVCPFDQMTLFYCISMFKFLWGDCLMFPAAADKTDTPMISVPDLEKILDAGQYLSSLSQAIDDYETIAANLDIDTQELEEEKIQLEKEVKELRDRKQQLKQSVQKKEEYYGIDTENKLQKELDTMQAKYDEAQLMLQDLRDTEDEAAWEELGDIDVEEYGIAFLYGKSSDTASIQIKHLKEAFPNAKFINDFDKLNPNDGIAIYLPKYMNHSEYYKARTVVRRKKMTALHFVGGNPDQVKELLKNKGGYHMGNNSRKD